ncbi:MAG: hypothetical protein QUS14_13230, partial [Pyrinomonadaceae bacterium]|nr:hypothetical protein [Pyrinomonadaceae bacterium]
MPHSLFNRHEGDSSRDTRLLELIDERLRDVRLFVTLTRVGRCGELRIIGYGGTAFRHVGSCLL